MFSKMSVTRLHSSEQLQWAFQLWVEHQSNYNMWSRFEFVPYSNKLASGINHPLVSSGCLNEFLCIVVGRSNWIKLYVCCFVRLLSPIWIRRDKTRKMFACFGIVSKTNLNWVNKTAWLLHMWPLMWPNTAIYTLFSSAHTFQKKKKKKNQWRSF